MAGIIDEATGTLFAPLKERLKHIPWQVAVVLVAAWYFPWKHAQAIAYELAQRHPGALFYSLACALTVSLFCGLALVGWRRERVKRQALQRRSNRPQEPARCPNPSHSLEELVVYEKIAHAGALWDVRLLGHKNPRLQVNQVRILADAAYCPKCKNVRLHLDPKWADTIWLCPSCDQSINGGQALTALKAQVQALAFARYKTENPTALNDSGG